MIPIIPRFSVFQLLKSYVFCKSFAVFNLNNHTKDLTFYILVFWSCHVNWTIHKVTIFCSYLTFGENKTVSLSGGSDQFYTSLTVKYEGSKFVCGDLNMVDGRRLSWLRSSIPSGGISNDERYFPAVATAYWPFCRHHATVPMGTRVFVADEGKKQKGSLESAYAP